MAIALEAASAAGTFKSPLLLPKSSMSLTSLALENRRRVDIFSPSRLTKINLVRNSRHFNSARSAAISASTVFSKKCEKPIIVIDNYDSFTYNLCQAVLRFGDISSTSKDCGVLMVSNPCSLSLYLGELGCKFEVYRNDELTVEELKGKHPRGVLISPGPGTPQDSGISLQTVLELGPIVPLFGVCMGLQCIGEAFGGKIVRSPYGVVHGKSSPVYYDEKGEGGLFTGLSNPFLAGRYHSLVIEKESFPSEELEITAWTEDGLIMGARHKIYKHLQGVQFHPESIITTEGKTIVCNFVKLIERLEAAEVEEN